MPPTATITVIPNQGPNPLTVYCSSQVAGGAPPYTYDWSFGDGTPDATTPSVVHIYAAGTFTLTLTVTDADGVEVEASAPVVVSAAIPPATFTPTATQACVATNPGPLAQMAAPVGLRAIPAGDLGAVDSGQYYSRCDDEWISSSGIPIGVTVASVANVDGTLNIGPNQGNVVASLNLGHANAWMAKQTFNAGIDGAGTTGGLSAGTGILNAPNDWAAAQNVRGVFQVQTAGGAETVFEVVPADGTTGTLYNSLDDGLTGKAQFAGELVGGAQESVGGVTVGGIDTAQLSYGYSAASSIKLNFYDIAAAKLAMSLYTSAVTIAAGYVLSVASTSNVSDARLKPDFQPYAGDPLAELDRAVAGQFRHMGLPGQVRDLGSMRAGIDARSLPESVRLVTPEGYAAIEAPAIFGWFLAVLKAQRGEIRMLESRLGAVQKHLERLPIAGG